MIMNKLNVEQSFYLITFYTFYNVQTHISRGNVQNLNTTIFKVILFRLWSVAKFTNRIND